MRFTVLMGAIAVLGASIALNVILFSQAKKYYLELNETRLDPVGLSTYSTSPSPSQNRPRVVFFGDSRAENWTFPEMSQYEFIDRGISSQTSVQAIQRFQQHVRPLQPRVIIVQVGINDLKTIALFPERKAEIIENCRSNIERIVQESKALGAIVILTTIFPVGDVPLQRQLFWSDEIGQAVQEMNRELAALASDRVMIFDAFSILADSQGKLRSDYRMDELHLNQQGYSRLNQALIEPLEMLKL